MKLEHSLNIYIFDEQQLVIRGLISTLATGENYNVTYTSVDVKEGLEKIFAHQPDMVLTDIMFQGKPAGIDLIRTLKEKYPGIITIVLTNCDLVHYVKQSFDAGAAAYINKDDSPDNLLFGVKQALSGKKYISAELSQKILDEHTTITGNFEKTNHRLNVYAAVLENIHDSVCLIDESGSINYVNDNTTHLLGFTRDELLTMSIADISPRLKTAAWSKFRSELEKQSRIVYKTFVRKKNKNLLLIEINVFYHVLNNQKHILILARNASEQNKFKNLADGLLSSVARFDTNARFLYANPYLLNKLKVSLDDILGKKPTEIFRNRQLEEFTEDYVLQTLESGKEFGTENIHGHTPEGDPVWLSSQFYPEFDDNGKIESVLMIRKNISVKKESLKQIEILNFALDHVNEAAFLFDKEGNMLYANQGACLSLGYKKEELIKLRLSDFDTNFVHDTWNQAWQCLKEQKTSTIETFHKRKNGTLFPVEVVGNYFEFEGVGYNLALVRDISDRKEAQKKIVENEKLKDRLEKTIRTIPGAIVLFTQSQQGMLSSFYSSDYIKELTGFFIEDIANNIALIKSRIDPDDLELLRKIFKEPGDNPSGAHLEIRYEHPQKGLIWIEGYFSNVREGSNIQWICCCFDVTKRKKTEDSLLTSEREFRTLAESIPDNIIRFNAEGFGYFANQNMQCTAEEMDYKWLKNRPTEQPKAILKDPQHFQNTVNFVLTSGKSAEIEVEVITNPDQPEIHDVRFIPEYDNNRNIIGVLTIGRNMTESKTLKDSLLKSERQFRVLAENIPDFIIQYDTDCRALYANPAMRKRLRAIEGDFVGKMPIERNPPVMKNPDKYQECVERVLENEVTETIEIEIYDSKGELKKAQCKITPIFDESGVINGALTIGRDITEKLIIENRIIESEEKLRLVLGSANIGIWEWDLNNDLWQGSSVYYNQLGYEPKKDAENRQEWFARVHPDDLDIVKKKMEELRLGILDYCQYEVRLKHADGAWRWFDIKGFHRPKNRGVGRKLIVGVQLNITERKQAEEILRRREQEMGELVRQLIRQKVVEKELPSLDNLTPREKMVFILTGKGYSYLEIARQMNISEHTVNTHKNNIKEKIDVRSSSDLLQVAMKYVSLHPEA